MVEEQFPEVRAFAHSSDDAANIVSGSCQHGLERILPIAGHVVVGMIARHQHEGVDKYVVVFVFFHKVKCLLEVRISLDCGDEDVAVTG